MRVTRPLPLLGEADARFAIAALGADGEVVALDAQTGEPLASTPSLDASGPIDIVFDVEGPSLFAFEAAEGEEGGDVVRFPVTPTLPAFGLPIHAGWIDGIARFASLHEGLLTFEENIGARWKLSPRDGGLTVSASCPRPASIDVRPSNGRDADAGTDLVGISWPPMDGGNPVVLEMHVSTSGLGPCMKHELEEAPTSARTGVLADGRVVLAGVADGAVELRALVADELGEPSALDVPAETVEAVVKVGAAAPHAALILTTGPSRLVLVELGAGTSPTIVVRAVIDLAGEVTREDRFFSRSVAVAGRRAFVVTDAGVRAFDLVSEGRMAHAVPGFVRGAMADLPRPARDASVVGSVTAGLRDLEHHERRALRREGLGSPLRSRWARAGARWCSRPRRAVLGSPASPTPECLRVVRATRRSWRLRRQPRHS